jgi:hypothetical protein
VIGGIITYINDEYYLNNFLDFLSSILLLIGLSGTISCTILLLQIAPKQHYRIQYMNPNGEVVTIEDATNVTHRNSEIIEYTCDGENYTIKSDFVEIKEKK